MMRIIIEIRYSYPIWCIVTDIMYSQNKEREI